MVRRRATPDGLPFRLFERKGTRKYSIGYKLPDGKWAFRLAAPIVNKARVAQIRKEAIQRANELNGEKLEVGSIAALISDYFDWQDALPEQDERKKAAGTLTENKRESKNLIAVFGKMAPAALKKRHGYQYLDARANAGAPAKANKELALLSAVIEYGIRTGKVDISDNPCRNIKYNPTQPKTKLVQRRDLDFVVEVARKRGGSYLVIALALKTAYLALCRPNETRTLRRNYRTEDGLEIPVGKRKTGQAQKTKLAEWSPELKATIDEAIMLQRTSGVYIFGNTSGQVYSIGGWATILSRLMVHCETEAATRNIEFERFTLVDMRPMGTTKKKSRGDTDVIDATGHADDRMVEQIYDRRRVRKFTPSE